MLALIIGILTIVGIYYGVSILLVGIAMWALCKLGIIAVWTWKQAALWAIVLTIVGGFFKSTSSKGDK